MMRLATFSAELEQDAGRVALCARCSEQHRGDPNGIAIEALAVCVHAGYCHNCGAGWCECRGTFPCDYCPRRNSHVILSQPLTLFRIVVPRAPSTIPRPL